MSRYIVFDITADDIPFLIAAVFTVGVILFLVWWNKKHRNDDDLGNDPW